jgi:hypothetical protein
MNEQSRYDLTLAFNNFMSKVYGWMFFGLLLTAITSYITFSAGLIFIFNPIVYIVLFIAQLILVVSISSKVHKLNVGTTKLLYLAYSMINGLTLSFIFYVYASSTIYQAFIVASLTFGVMSIYGYFTKTNLSGIGSILYFVLFGLIITMVLNLFIQSGPLDYAITLLGLLLFWGLTAYDTQKLKGYFLHSSQNNPDKMSNYAVSGALTLYLDFINIFIFLLRLFGRRR